MELVEGETIEVKGRQMRVTPLAMECLPRIREVLVGVARVKQTITYSDLKREAQVPHSVNGQGRLLDMLSEDCFRRDEPSLAALVVNGDTGEVGDDFEGDPVTERELVYGHWA